MARKAVNYVENSELMIPLTQYVNQYKEAKKKKTELPRVPEEVGKAIKLIAENTSTRPNFSGYSFREDMVLDGIETCIRYIHNFKPEKSNNPFSYITLIVWRAFIRRIAREEKESAVRHKMMMNHSDIYDSMERESAHATKVIGTLSHQKSADIVQNYERKLSKGKDKVKD